MKPLDGTHRLIFSIFELKPGFCFRIRPIGIDPQETEVSRLLSAAEPEACYKGNKNIKCFHECHSKLLS